jgi:branched-chain amino acid transport system substrate-binding protein
MKDSFRKSAVSATILFLVASLILVLSACAKGASKAKKEPKEIKIGAILPLTGENSSLGQDCKNGIILAADDYGFVKLYFEDSQGKPVNAVSALDKLISSNINLIIGDLFSAPTLAMIPIVDRNHVLLISPGASSPKLSNSSKYFFRNYPSDNYEGKILADYIRGININTMAILYPNNDYGIGLSEVFIEEFHKLGGRVLLKEGYDENATDFRSILAKLPGVSIQGLYLPGYYGSVGRIAVQLKEQKIKVPLFSNVGVEDPALIQIAGDSVENMVYTAPTVYSSQNDPLTIKFKDDYIKRFRKEPGFPAAYGYDTAKILFSLIENSGDNPDLLCSQLLQGEFIGITGKTKFNASGDVTKPFVIKLVKGGEFLLKKEMTM